MQTKDLDILKINLLTKDQYDREQAAGNISPNEIYIQDLSSYATKEYVDNLMLVDDQTEV